MPTNHHSLINIHHLRFHQSLEKPPASTPQEGVFPDDLSSVNRLNVGSIASLSSPLLLSSSKWSLQCQLLHLNLSRSFLSGNVVRQRGGEVQLGLQKVNCDLFDWLIWLLQLDKSKCIINQLSNCVTRAPLLYFVRSWVALSLLCESVSQSVRHR